jgi:RNA polymerase sigma-70 factor (ECF subfamily)
MLPETRESLLIRLADAADAAAWDEFAAIYRPVIVRIGLRKGLQATDADDLAQQVLMSVSRVIGDWEKDPDRGTFRGWLRTVARNAISNLIQRSPKDKAVGGSAFLQACQAVNTPSDEIERWIDDEHERAVLRLAAARVERQVSPTTWQAFWRTASDGESVPNVAEALGVSVGKVYGARGRVMRMLQHEVAKLRDDDL